MTAVRSVMAQTVAVEVLVIDDGSSDGTENMIREQFPSVQFHRSEQSFGYIVQRNRAAHMASGDIIFSIDDDAEFHPQRGRANDEGFQSPENWRSGHSLYRTLKDNSLRQVAPDDERAWITDAFVGTAHALRRDIFLSLGGYRDSSFTRVRKGTIACDCLPLVLPLASVTRSSSATWSLRYAIQPHGFLRSS